MSVRNEADRASAAAQARTSALARRFQRAATKSLISMSARMESILRKFRYKGGFVSKAEAKRWLSGRVDNDVYNDLVGIITEVPDKKERLKMLDRLNASTMAYNYNRLDAIKDIIKVNRRVMEKAIRDDVAPMLFDMTDDLYSRQMFMVQKQVGVGWRMDSIPGGQIVTLFNSRLDATVERFGYNVSKNLLDAVTEGLLTGQTPTEISKAVTSANVPPSRTVATVRTMMTEVSNEAEMKALKDSGIAKYEYVATLDERTCPVCGRLDGRVFAVSDAKKGINMPPMHPNCRCTHIAALTDDIKTELTRFARDAEGKRISVPASMTYEQWRKEFYGQSK